MSNDEPFFFHFCILHVKKVWILLKLEMALVTTIEMKFALVCFFNEETTLLNFPFVVQETPFPESKSLQA